MASNTNPLVPLLTLVAAMGGGAVGAALSQPTRVHEPAEPDLTPLNGLVGDLRQALARLGVDRSPMVQPAPRLERRGLVGDGPGVEDESGGGEAAA